MSLNAQAMLEVNRPLIYASVPKLSSTCPMVVSVATFGRGIRQDWLRQIESYRSHWGHNQSLIAVPPLPLVADLLKDPDWTLPAHHPESPGFWVMGYALGASCLQLWPWVPSDDQELF